MTIRSLMLTLAVGFAGCVATDATDETATATQQTGGFSCQNKQNIQVVSCIGSISVLPIDIDVKNVRVLDNSELNVLSNDLNNLSVLDGNVLDNNKILNDAEVTVLQDFLNKFDIDVTRNDIDVCTTVLGILVCR
jgi:hypothetical protein